MNERIKELMEQASSGACYDENTPTLYGTEIEKFAELIVAECIEQARSVGDLRGVNDDMIYGADYAALQISKHFGVE